MSSAVTLFRPAGPAELALVAASGFRRFPRPPPTESTFHVVCNATYAIEIASEWHAVHDGGGYVLRFDVRLDCLSRYPKQVVGSRHHEEHWIPAGEVDAFNAALVSPIVLLHAFDARARAS